MSPRPGQPSLPQPSPQQSATQPARYRPTRDQLDSPDKLMAVFKQVLDQHYALVDQHARTVAALDAAHRQLAKLAATPPGNGPVNSRILGAPVQPADLSTLATGATLKWDKASGTFIFS